MLELVSQILARNGKWMALTTQSRPSSQSHAAGWPSVSDRAAAQPHAFMAVSAAPIALRKLHALPAAGSLNSIWHCCVDWDARRCTDAQGGACGGLTLRRSSTACN